MQAIELLSVYPVYMSHTHGQIACDGFKEQVVVVAHQAIGVATPIETLCRFLDQIEEVCPVAVILKYRHPGISPRRNVINGPWIFNAQWSSHVSSYTGKSCIARLDPNITARPDPIYDIYHHISLTRPLAI